MTSLPCSMSTAARSLVLLPNRLEAHSIPLSVPATKMLNSAGANTNVPEELSCPVSKFAAARKLGAVSDTPAVVVPFSRALTGWRFGQAAT